MGRLSDNLSLKDCLKQTMQAVKRYTDNTFMDKEAFDADLFIALENFRESLNTASLNEIYVDLNEQDASYEGIDLFSIQDGTVQKPEGGNAVYYRIPALTITAAETIIAFSDVRYDYANDNWGRISIFCRRSEDKGITWGDPIEVCKFPTDSNGNPFSGRSRSMDATVLSSKSGKVFCVNAAWKSNEYNWTTYTAVPDPDWTFKISVSNDDGKTWTTTDIKNNPNIIRNMPTDIVAMQGGVGQGIEMYDGTLVFPLQLVRIVDNVKIICASIMYSKDDGATWTVAHGRAPATDSENNVVEMSPGVLLMNCRGGAYRPTFMSKDLGETWEVYYDLNGEINNGAYGCQGSSTKIRLNNNEIYLHSSPINNTNDYRRDKITLYASYDWKNYDLIRTYYPPAGNADGAGYSCLATGKIGGQNCLFALYERQGNIAFRNLGLDLKVIASRADKHFEEFNREFEVNKENLLTLLAKYSASEIELYEMLDNYLNTVSYEERELLKVQLTKLVGVDEKNNVIDRQGVIYEKTGEIKTVGNTYYYGGIPENAIFTQRVEVTNDFTVDFDVNVIGMTETLWNYIFSMNDDNGQTGFGFAADNSNEWKIVYRNNSESYYEESIVAGQSGSFLGNWVHVTITKSSEDGIKIYHNNVLKHENMTAVGDIINCRHLTVGNDSQHTKRVNAKIANFKIYNKVINAQERRVLYEARKKESEYVYRISPNATKVLAGLETNAIVNIVGSRTDEFDLVSVYDSGQRETAWGIGGSVRYDIDDNMLIFDKNYLNIVNTSNFLSIDFTIDLDVYIDGVPGTNWSQIYCIGNLQGGVPGFGLAVNGTSTWNPIVDGDGAPTYEDPSGNFIGKWIHLTMVKSSTRGCEFYHDGQLLWSNTNGTQSMAGYPTMAIGNNTHPVKELHAKIANFKIYNKALTASEIQQVFNAIGRIILRANYTPGGASFSNNIDSTWATQKLVVTCNLDTCTNDNGENVISIGQNIGSWSGNNVHFYYYPTTKRMLIQCMQGGAATNIELFNMTGEMTVEFSSEGLTVNKKHYAASGYPTFANIAALTTTQVGSTEGSGRSNASNYSIMVKNK